MPSDLSSQEPPLTLVEDSVDERAEALARADAMLRDTVAPNNVESS